MLKRKISLVISSIATVGGAERNVVLMANYWADSGDDVTIASLDDDSLPPAYPCSDKVKLVRLNVNRISHSSIEAIRNNVALLRRIRSFFRASNPDVIISFIDVTNVRCLLATRGLGIAVIVSERTSPAHAPIARSWHLLRRLTYRHADAVVVQTKGAAAHFPSISSLHTIPNPVSPRPRSAPAERAPLIAAVGRLSREKRFDALIEVFATLAPRYPEWNLVIAGEGSERKKLEDLVSSRSLEDRVTLPGRVNIDDLFARASVFVMNSEFEGFPNALCEAMASGLAVVSSDCPVGPREIVRDGVDGILVPVNDGGELASQLERLITDATLRERLGEKAIEISTRFDIDRVMAAWDSVITSVESTK